jgi:hypothetical protein
MKDISNMATYSLQSKMNLKEVIYLCDNLGKPLTKEEKRSLREVRRVLKRKSRILGF